MRFSAVTIASLATLAVASPVNKRAPESSVPSWVCDYWPSVCNGNSTGSGAATTPTPTPVTEAAVGATTPEPTTATAAATSTSTGAASSGNEWVTLHNNYRAKHVDTPNVEWDDALAAGAKEHSEKCVFEHSSSDGDYGENLAMGSGLTAQQTVDMWYDEISDYGPYWGKDDVPMSVMHFTQVVWKKTTKVGCGVASCSDGSLVTCRYQESGNYLGEFAANVGELKSSS
ncbi:allergen v5 tpx-1-related protein [Diplodia corticola]|uniref:Allergen v5 tpx-1-related protein n=1 Tax=Diplodia corticola TaxID=236234 RepID=A0A1J9SGH3_9PEZI|nr:allergen v5 tpx-1-related protein [Diplodia corticola]OJD38685.1 allergen v5 tpx-1-related protein [Diplodia corticola]